VGFLDALLGTKGKLKGPAPDRLFAMTTANVTMETGLGLKTRGSAGVVFQPIGTADFKQMVAETEELLAGTAEETGTKIETHDDEYGYRWLILEDPDFDDLVVAMNTVSVELQGAGYGDRLLASAFAYEDENGKPVYFLYNFKRGKYYPFVPAPGDKARNTEEELRIKAQLARDLPWEEDMARWFPLWDIPL
jgi:PspA associated protein B